MSFSLKGKIALVTGAGRGIGAAIVRRFADAGASVALANRTNDYSEALAAELRQQGHRATTYPFIDLSRRGIAGLVADVARDHSNRLDIVVHNAGGCPWSDLEMLEDGQLDDVLDLNLKACFWLAQAAIPTMRANGQGRILVTSSVSARVAFGGGAHYSAAKAGVNAFIRGAGFELARDNITVNGVEPGFIAKPGRGRMGSEHAIAALGRHIPMGRMGDANDIAHAMLFLASDEARYITGQTIVVDGGATLPETGYAVEDRWGRK